MEWNCSVILQMFKYYFHDILLGTALNAKSDEDNSETLAATVVEKAIVIFNHVSNIIKTSTRAGGHVSFSIIMSISVSQVDDLYIVVVSSEFVNISDTSKSRSAWSLVADFRH